MGYAAAGFTTFMTILGRYDLGNTKIDSCCSVLEQQSNKGFLANLVITFKNFGIGVSKLISLHRQPNIKYILKTSLIILITAETGCRFGLTLLSSLILLCQQDQYRTIRSNIKIVPMTLLSFFTLCFLLDTKCHKVSLTT